MNKPFDLEAFKKGEPAVTRDGESAKFIAYEPAANDAQRVIFLVGSTIVTCRENGYQSETHINGVDLFMAPRKRTVWVNAYRDSDDSGLCGSTWGSKEAADRAGRKAMRIGNRAWPLEIEE